MNKTPHNNLNINLDYYPFGMLMPGRQSSSESYRYGFQGQERDDEVKGNGNSLNYRFRMHDPRLGRFFAVDPLTSKYPHYTPYQFGGNKPIWGRELEGMENEVDKQTYITPDGGSITLPEGATPGNTYPQSTDGSGTVNETFQNYPQGGGFCVAGGSLESFSYNDETYRAQYAYKDGSFAGYKGVRSGRTLNYGHDSFSYSEWEWRYESGGTEAAAVATFGGDTPPALVAAGITLAGVTAMKSAHLITKTIEFAMTKPLDAPFAIPYDVVTDDGVNTKPYNGMLTIFRGVPSINSDGSVNPAYAPALTGVAVAQGGSANPLDANMGKPSNFTFWSINPWVAYSFATRKGTTNGVVITTQVPWGMAMPNASPDKFNQGEFQLPSGVVGIPTPVGTP